MNEKKTEFLKTPLNGFYRDYGGAYIPELLAPQISELQNTYSEVIYSPEFRKTFYSILKYYAGRPTPLYYAERMSEKYRFHIYFKREDLNHTGSHKLNNVVGQILLAQALGKKSIIAETGAGQHGVATATVCAKVGIPCKVFMGEIDVERQQPNVKRMKMLGAEVIPVTSGSRTLKDATNEALRYWIQHPETYYLLGSAVGPHPYPEMVACFQSVISEEIKQQTSEMGIQKINTILACVGGGSNAIGAFYHFIDDTHVHLIGVEAAGEGIHSGHTAATLTKGSPGIFHGFKSYVLQDEFGQIQEAHSVSAGLDYPGVGPIHAYLKDIGRARYVAVTDKEALEAAVECTRLEGIIPALESAHALAYLKKIEASADDVVIVNLSGRGDKDMETYLRYLSI